MRRVAAVAALALLVAAGTAGAALGPASQFLRTSSGGYANACEVVRIEPGLEPFNGDSTYLIPAVRVTLSTRERVWLDQNEGTVDTVVLAVDAAMQQCRTVTAVTP